MTSFQISEPTIKHWLEQLSTTELEDFNTLVDNILSRRKGLDKLHQEQELVKKINQQVDKTVLSRLKELQKKQKISVLSEQEYEELFKIIEQIENFDAERIINLGKLAQLKNVSITELLEQLKIHPKVNGEIIHS